MGLREKVALVVVAVILQASCTDCMPQSLKRNPFEHYINNVENKKNTANNVLKGTKFSGKSNGNVNQETFSSPCFYKAFNFPQVDFPSDKSYKDPFMFSPDSINSGSKLSESSVMLNNLRKEARRKRKSNRQANKDVVPMHTQPDFGQISKPFHTAELGGFPEVEYPLSTMDIWAPKYWNPLPYDASKPYLKTDDNIYQSKLNTRQKNTGTSIKPFSMKGNKGLFAVVQNTKEMETLNTETPMNDNNDSYSATINSSLPLKSRPKSKKPTLVPFVQKKPNVNRKVLTKSSKTRLRSKSHSTQTQNKNITECSTNKMLNKSLPTCYRDTTNQTVDNITLLVSAAILENPIPFSPNTDRLNDLNSSFQSVLISGECPSDVICESPNVVSNAISSKITHDSIRKTTELNENDDIFDTKNKVPSSIALENSEYIIKSKNPTSLYSPITGPVTQHENNVNVTIHNSAEITSETLSGSDVIFDTATDKLPTSHILANYAPNIDHNTTAISDIVSNISTNTANQTDIISSLFNTQTNSSAETYLNHTLLNTATTIKSLIENKTDTSSKNNLPEKFYHPHETLLQPELSFTDSLVSNLFTEIPKSNLYSQADLLKFQLKTLSTKELRDLAQKILAQVGPESEEYPILESSIENNLLNSVTEKQRNIPTEYVTEAPIKLDQNDYTIIGDSDPPLTEYILLPNLLTNEKSKEGISSSEGIPPTELMTPNTFICDNHAFLPDLIEITQPEKLTDPSVLIKTSDSQVLFNDQMNVREFDDYEGPLLSPRVISDLSALYNLVQSILTHVDIIPKNKFSDNFSNKIATSTSKLPIESVLFDSTKPEKLSNRVMTAPIDQFISGDFKTNHNDSKDKLFSSYIEANANSGLPYNHTTTDTNETTPHQTTPTTVAILTKDLNSPLINTEQNRSNSEILYEKASLHSKNGNYSHSMDLYCPLSTLDQCTIFDHPENNTLPDKTVIEILSGNVIENTLNISKISLDQNATINKFPAFHNFLSLPMDFKGQSNFLDKETSSQLIQHHDLPELVDEYTLSIKPDSDALSIIVLNNNTQSNLKKNETLFVQRNNDTEFNIADIPNKETHSKIPFSKELTKMEYTFTDIPKTDPILIFLENNTLLDTAVNNMFSEKSNNDTDLDLPDVEIFSAPMEDIKITDIIKPGLDLLKLNTTFTNEIVNKRSDSDEVPDILDTNVTPNQSDTDDMMTEIFNTNEIPISVGIIKSEKLYFDLAEVKPNMSDINIILTRDTSENDMKLNMSDSDAILNKLDINLTSGNTKSFPKIDKLLLDTTDADILSINPGADQVSDIPGILMLTEIPNTDRLSDIPDIVEFKNSHYSKVLDIFKASGLQDSPDFITLPNMSKINAFTDMSDTNKLINVSDITLLDMSKTNKIANVTVTDRIHKRPNLNDLLDPPNTDGQPDTFSVTILPNTFDTSVLSEMSNNTDKPDTDLKSVMSNTGALSDFSETDTLLNISDTIPSLPQLSNIDILSEIININALQHKAHTNHTKQTKPDINDASLDLPKTVDLPDNFDAISLSDIYNPNTLPEISDNTFALLNMSNAVPLIEMTNTFMLPDTLLEISDTIVLPEMLNMDKVPETIDKNAILDKTDTNKLPDIFGTNALPDLNNSSELPDTSDCATLSDIFDTDLLSEISNNDVLPDVPDTVALTDMLDIEALPGMPDVDVRPDRSNTNTSLEISDAITLLEIAKVPDTIDGNDLQDKTNTDKLSDILYTDTILDLLDTGKLPYVSDSGVLSDNLNTDALSEMYNKIAIQDIPDTIVPTDISGTSVSPDIPNLDVQPELRNIDTLLDMSDTVDLFDIPRRHQKLSKMIDTTTLPEKTSTDKLSDKFDTDALPDQLDVSELLDISDISSFSIIPDSDNKFVLPDMPNTIASTNMSYMERKFDMPNSDALPEMSDTFTLPEMPNINKVSDKIYNNVMREKSETDHLPNIIDTDTLPDLPDADDLPDISNSTALLDISENISDTDALPVLSDKVTLTNMLNTIASTDVLDTVVLTDKHDIDIKSDLLNTNALKHSFDTDELPDMSDDNKILHIVDALLDMPRVHNLSEMIDTNALQNNADTQVPDISDTDASLELPNTIVPTDRSGAVMVPDIPDTNMKPDMTNTDALSDISDPVTLKVMSSIDKRLDTIDINALLDKTDADKLPYVFDTGALPDSPDASDLPDKSETTALPEISDTDRLPVHTKTTFTLSNRPDIDALTNIYDIDTLLDKPDTVAIPDAANPDALLLY